MQPVMVKPLVVMVVTVEGLYLPQEVMEIVLPHPLLEEDTIRVVDMEEL